MTDDANEPSIQTGLEHHRAGRFDEAEKVYRRILEKRPDDADALYFLGTLAAQRGRTEEAVELLRLLVRHRPGFADGHFNLGVCLQNLGKRELAVGAYRQAIQLHPDYALAYNNLALLLVQANQLSDAIACFQHIARISPDSAEAQSNLGNALLMASRFDEAITACRRAIELKADLAEAHNNLGSALQSRGDLPGAIAAYRAAISIQSEFPEALNNLGNALAEMGSFDDAIAACREAVRIRPGFAAAHSNLGNALRHRGEIKEAISECKRAIEINPNLAHGFNNLGNALNDNLQFEEAIDAYRQAIELNPNHAGPYSNLAIVLKEIGDVERAIAAARRAILIDPGFGEAHTNLGNILWANGQIDECIAACRRGVELRPHSADAHSALLFFLQYHTGYDPAMILEEHQRWYERHARALAASIGEFTSDRDPNRRLRIGYVSPYFRDHCQSFFTIPLFSSRNRVEFEVFCYSDVANPDAVTERIRNLVDAWQSTAGMADEKVARIIREDKIDILVDLTMHMAGGRPLVFARKPAPIQVAWLAYPGTTGLPTIDYRLTDPWLDPPGQNDAIYTEKTVRLGDTFWCYYPYSGAHPPGDAPAERLGYVTFGCLNNLGKVNEQVLRLWARVLRRVENSHLLMLSAEGNHRQAMLDVFQSEGVDPQRVEMMPRCPRAEYLQSHYQIDIGLDTFPYNGHTTSMDAMWMGVPVVTLRGSTVVGRAGASQLTNLKLTELIAQTPDEFVEIAARLAGDLPRMVELHRTLRDRMMASPLTDASRFARNVESAFRQMWKTWCGRE